MSRYKFVLTYDFEGKKAKISFLEQAENVARANQIGRGCWDYRLRLGLQDFSYPSRVTI